jgi:hypothetical protein
MRELGLSGVTRGRTVSYVNPEGEYTVTYEKQDGFDY